MFGKAGSAMNLRVPHPLRSLQRVGYANVGIDILDPSQNARRTPDFLWGLVGTDELHAVFLKVVTGVADPRGMKRSSAGSATNLRVPHPPGFPVRRGGVNELHAAFLVESRTSGHRWGCVVGNPGSFAHFAKGGIQESRYQHSRIPPFAKNAKDGAPGGWSPFLPFQT